MTSPEEEAEYLDLQAISLVRKGGKGFDEGVTLLFQRHSIELRRYFAYHCRDKSIADDLVQETFIKVFKSIDSYRGESSARSWIWAIARNCMYDFFRSKKGIKFDSIDDDGWDSIHQEGVLATNSTEDIIEQSVEDCVNNKFELFAAKSPARAYALSLKMDGYGTRYIADVIQRSEGATREFLSQSRKKIESFLAPCRELLST